MLRLENLHVYCEETPILHGIDIHVPAGELHVMMGPNGAGKSTCAKVLFGEESLSVSTGELLLSGEDLISMSSEERAHAGLFVGMQQPPEIPGVGNKDFFRRAYNACQRAKGKKELSSGDFDILLRETLACYPLEVPEFFFTRNVNEGFSGGEKKKNEILQMIILEPKCIILDEPDSGVDIDAWRNICSTISVYRELHPESAFLLITHNPKLRSVLTPDRVHILLDGRIAASGDASIMEMLEAKSFSIFEA